MEYRYVAYLNDYGIAESDNFKQIYDMAVFDGIINVRYSGYSRILRIVDQKTHETVCPMFFNQRHDELGTDYAYVRVKSRTNHKPAIPTRRFKIN